MSIIYQETPPSKGILSSIVPLLHEFVDDLRVNEHRVNVFVEILD